MKRIAFLFLLFACTACASTTELRILSYNVKHGHGNDDVVDISRAASLIKKLSPDLVVLQEIDNGVRRTGGEDQMAKLGELTGMHARFGDFMPYQGGLYGMGLLSRFEILESRNHRLPDGSEPRTALDARVRLPNGDEVVMCGVHFYQTEEQRMAQAQTVVDVYRDTDIPVLVAGDFNSKPGSPVITLFEQHWANPDKGEDRLTIPSDGPRSEIDFAMYRPADRFEVVSIDVIDEPVISDHRPVLLVLRMK